MNIKTLLRNEIGNEIGELGKMDLGTEEYKTTVDGIAKLTDRFTELEKLEFERQDKYESRESEEEFRQVQMKEERKKEWIRNSVTIAGIILPLAVTIWGTRASFKFEEEGTITTVMGRGFLNKLLPKK